jgi:hypothetical protein
VTASLSGCFITERIQKTDQNFSENNRHFFGSSGNSVLSGVIGYLPHLSIKNSIGR